MPHYNVGEIPEWVGVALRWPDGRIEAFELRGRISAEITATEDEDIDWYTRFNERYRRPPTRTFRIAAEGTEMTLWRQGADAAPKQPDVIEPERKAIEA